MVDDGQHRGLRHYDRRMVGYLLEHPAAAESVRQLGQRHGEDRLRLTVIDASDTVILHDLPDADAGDVLWHTADKQHAGIVKRDGIVWPPEERP